MPRRVRLALLVLALALATPAVVPARASATDLLPGVEVKIPKSLIDWLKKNGPTLYIIVDEFIDDVCGCPPPPPPVPMDPPPPW